MLKKTPPLSASLSIISFNAASSLDTDLLIMPVHMSVGTLVSDQSLTIGGVLRAGKLCREIQHRKCDFCNDVIIFVSKIPHNEYQDNFSYCLCHLQTCKPF